jgi:hypothetical protein
MLTLSISNCTDLKEQSDLLRKCFRRLRQRRYWQSKVTGGCYILEVAGTPGNWHIHIHAIIAAKYFSYPRLINLWKKVSGGRGCHIKTINGDAVIRYITKYVTKTGLPVGVQLSASAALKGTRLFNPFGTWHDLCNAIPKIKFVCPDCGEVSWYMTEQAVDVENHKLLSGLGEHDKERWAVAEQSRRLDST